MIRYNAPYQFGLVKAAFPFACGGKRYGDYDEILKRWLRKTKMAEIELQKALDCWQCTSPMAVFQLMDEIAHRFIVVRCCGKKKTGIFMADFSVAGEPRNAMAAEKGRVHEDSRDACLANYVRSPVFREGTFAMNAYLREQGAKERFF